MKDQNNLSRDTMWKATVTCDSAYDGIFFYAVKTTGVFCRPSCKSKVPNYENVSFFKCARSSKGRLSPMQKMPIRSKYKNIRSVRMRFERYYAIDKNNYVQNMSLNEIASRVGVSRFHLNRIFKERTGYTPRIYLERIRVKKAKELLLTTVFNSTEIGYQTGYQSVSSFYNAFKRNTGFSPSQFRAFHSGNTVNQELD